MLLLDIAEALYYFDATLEDLDEYYLEAKKRAEEASDYIALARWCLEVDVSKKQEASAYLLKAAQSCYHPNDHMDIALLLIRNKLYDAATKHLQVANEHAADTNTLMQIAEAWLDLNKDAEAKKVLLKAEKVARNRSDFENVADAWEYWMEDNRAAKRCRAKASASGGV
ncbi:MAG: hypothetical protein IT279_10270 [Ignavibacteriaceae bacterium]|nr:hypothetical protein [Ignavibacteriaceae bacterium]